jgi:penicillin amidase
MPMSRHGRGLIIAAVLLPVVVAAGLGGWLLRSLPSYEAAGTLAGLDAAVTIVRDRHAVPHIFASDAHDAAMALGYVHAQDRLWQMEWHRRLVYGRLAEIAGEAALPADRLARALRLGPLAEEGYPLLAPEVRDALEAYAAGVNAFVAQAAALPPEFDLLGFRPQPWRPWDAVALLRGMAAQSSYNARDELIAARAARRLTPAQFEDLFPRIGRRPVAVGSLGDADGPLDRMASAFDSLPRAWASNGASNGASNVWALAGSLTASGHPILANDPHMELVSPALYYLARVVTPDGELVGATIAGIPFVIVGHNGRIAWGMTSSGHDVQDVFVEHVDPADPARYLAPGGSLAFATTAETIAVAGRAREAIILRETRHGPVLSDVGPRAAALATGDTVLALAYAARVADDRTIEALYRINRASGWAEFAAAARLWTAPPQNMVMASVDGHIGMISAGRLPRRAGVDGRLPRDGASGADDWTGVRPFDDLPVQLDPASGRIVNANDPIAAAGPDPDLGDAGDEGWRSARITALLDGAGPHDVAESLRMQSDDLAPEAALLVPLLTRARPASPRALAARDALAGWDRHMRGDRPEPLIYMAWLRELTRALLGERLGAAFGDLWQVRPNSLVRALGRPEIWCPDPGGCDAVIATALERALDDVAQRQGPEIATWRWDAEHRARIAHPVWSRIPLIGRLTTVDLALSGGDFTIGRAQVDLTRADAPFTAVVGASFRAVYDLADLGRSRYVIVPGQSGHPLSPHGRDLAALWRDGESVTLAGTLETLTASALATTRLRPP